MRKGSGYKGYKGNKDFVLTQPFVLLTGRAVRYLMLCLLCLSACQPSQSTKAQSMDIKKEDGYRYFERFDRFRMLGVDELKGDSVRYPFVKVVDPPPVNRVWFQLHIEKGFVQEEEYERRDDHYFRKEIEFLEDEALPYCTNISYLTSDTETRYQYQSADSTELGILVACMQARGSHKENLEFAVFGSEFSPKHEASPDLTMLREQAIMIKETSYSREGDELIIHKTTLDKENSNHVPETSQSSMALGDHPFFYLEWVPIDLL